MKKKQIKQLINDNYGKLQLHLNVAIKEFDMEEIHRFRVEFKKLRAFFRLITSFNENSSRLAISKKIKKYYQISGNLRNWQIFREHLIEAAGKQKTRVFLLGINKKMADLKACLSAAYTPSALLALNKKTAHYLPEKLPEKRMRFYLRNKWTFIESLVHSGDMTDSDIHFVRKQLKDLVYNLKLVGCLKEDHGIKKNFEANLDSLLDLLHQLGNYQDLAVNIKLLPNRVLPGLPASEVNMLRLLKKSEKQQKLELKKEVLKKLQQTLKQRVEI